MYNVILNDQKDDIVSAQEWVQENISNGKFKIHHPMFPSSYWNFLFEEEGDTIWFRLKWQH
jgi:hypothetical protein